MKEYFEYKCDSSSKNFYPDLVNKFWEIELDYEVVIIRSGEIGQEGKTTVKNDFYTAAEAKKYCNRLVKEMKAYGYALVKGNSPAEKIENSFGVKLPQVYKDFIDKKEYKKYTGLYVSGLPNYTADTKIKVCFDDPELDMLYAVNEIDKEKYPDYIPLSTLGEEPQFLAIDAGNDKCPVYMWEHEDCNFHQMSESFKKFLKSLTKKETPTSMGKLKKSYENAKKLFNKKKYAETVTELDKALKNYPIKRNPKDYFKDDDSLRGYLAVAYNLKGLSFKNLGKINEAVIEFQYGANVPAFKNMAGLNLLGTYCYDLKNYNKVINYCDKHDFYGDYDWFYAMKALAFSYLVTGDIDKATNLYKKIYKEFFRKDDKKIKKITDELENDIIKESKPNSDSAKEILAYFKEQATAPSEKTIQENRIWWNSLDKSGKDWKTHFKKELKTESEPTDDNIAYLLDLEKLQISASSIENITPLYSLKNLKTLSIRIDNLSTESVGHLKTLTHLEMDYNQIESLEPLKELTELIFLFVNKNLISNLEPLQNLKNLETLWLQGNKVESLEPVRSLTKLESLSFLNNRVTSIKPLKNLTNLLKLQCGDNKLESLDGIQNMKNLTKLFATSTNTSELKLLKGLTALKEIRISRNPVSNIEVLKYLNNLETLDCDYTDIKDLSPLSNCTNLKYIKCSYSKINDLSPLSKCTELESIKCSVDNELQGLLSLKDLPCLRKIELTGSSVGKKALAEFKKLRPDVEVI